MKFSESFTKNPPFFSIRLFASCLLESLKIGPNITTFEATAGSLILCIPFFENPPPT